MNQRIWTNEEDEYIKNNFGNKTFSEMAEHIGCAITTVQNRAKFLGFEVEKKTARRWNEEEIELLKIKKWCVMNIKRLKSNLYLNICLKVLHIKEEKRNQVYF